MPADLIAFRIQGWRQQWRGSRGMSATLCRGKSENDGHSFARATILDSVQVRHQPGANKDGTRHEGRLRTKEQER